MSVDTKKEGSAKNPAAKAGNTGGKGSEAKATQAGGKSQGTAGGNKNKAKGK